MIADQQRHGVAQPWKNEEFIDHIVRLQKQRQIDLSADYSDLQFYDRSPICTYALAVYLNFKPSVLLTQEIERLEKQKIYHDQVFFIDNLGFIEKTHARQITFEESLKFEKIHLDTYRKFGYQCVHIPAAPIEDRVKLIMEHV